MRFAPPILAAIAICIISLAACASFPPNGAQAELPKSSLIVETEQGQVSFTVELADEPDEIQTGMMFRQTIGENEGMLFDIGRTGVTFFWMHNTYIPLDIVFIDAQGRILNIAANATPLSDDPIYSQGPARGVLEIRGGRAAALGMVSGNLIRHALFGNE